jgi:hypothetical protein
MKKKSKSALQAVPERICEELLLAVLEVISAELLLPVHAKKEQEAAAYLTCENEAANCT